VSGWNCGEDMLEARDTLTNLCRNLQMCEKFQKDDRPRIFDNIIHRRLT
jgi:hypothetical protein